MFDGTIRIMRYETSSCVNRGSAELGWHMAKEEYHTIIPPRILRRLLRRLSCFKLKAKGLTVAPSRMKDDTIRITFRPALSLEMQEDFPITVLSLVPRCCRRKQPTRHWKLEIARSTRRMTLDMAHPVFFRFQAQGWM